jgi:uncharacterized membrane protein
MTQIPTLSNGPLITNDAIVFGLLMLIIGLVMYTSSRASGFWVKFHSIVPPLLLCYFLPAICFYPLNLISGEISKLNFVATNFLLPASLVLLCAGADIKSMGKLGSISLIIFFTAAAGVIIGGVVTFYLAIYVLPGLTDIEPTMLWKGMATICGSWIGGSANQTAIKEIYQVPENIFGAMLVVEVINTYACMALLLYGASKSKKIDKWLKADTSSLDGLMDRVSYFGVKSAVSPSTGQIIYLLVVGFTTVGLSHLLSELTLPLMTTNETWLTDNRLTAFLSPFFWMVLYATSIGIILSFTRVREVEAYGASKWASVFIYILVATLGMKMNLAEVFKYPGLFLIGFIWISIHLTILLVVAYLIKAPFFYVAVASQANIGGAASAPIVAAAFHPSLAPVGVIMAVMGYAIGTYGAILCAQIMAGLI